MTIRMITPSCQRSPTIMICKGIISKIVSRSSKIANTCTFLYTQEDFNPAAASIVKRMPADVGAANRLNRRFSFHASPLFQ